jgi:hypothetical protein
MIVSLSGCLIAESLGVGGAVVGVRLTVTRVSRAEAGDVDAGQPRIWSFIEFEAADEDGDRLAATLEGALQTSGGWYCDFRSETETIVVFAGRTFRYPRGDSEGRSLVAEYARSVGVPEGQLDWPA